MKIKLNKKNKAKILRILKQMTDKNCYNKYGQHIYEDWQPYQITRFIVEKHGITQEILDDFIEL